MTPLPAERPPRLPRPAAEMDQIALTVREILPAIWVNLRWKQDATPDRLFFASPTARLTPIGGKVPCLYLAPTRHTSFAELYGDRIYLAKAQGATPILAPVDLTDRVFLTFQMPALRLLDLTTGPAMEKTGLDLGTLYHANVSYPQAWAEEFFQLKLKVDGILYESRLTRESCAVVWNRRGRSPASVAPGSTEALAGSITEYRGDRVCIFGEWIQVAS